MNSVKQINLADISNRLNYVQLSGANQSILIGRIGAITANQSYIAIFDDQTNKLLLFDSKGAFLRVLMTKGRGPNEFVGINSIDINDNNEILVYKDGSQITIINPDNNSYQQFKLNNSPAIAKWHTDKTIVLIYPFPSYLLNDGYEISFLDLNGKILKKTMPNSIKHVNYSDWRANVTCERDQDTLYYWNEYRDTVFSITTDFKIIPRVILKHSRQRYPLELIKKNAKLRDGFSTDNGYILRNYHEFKDHIFISIVYKKTNFRLYIYRRTGIGYNVLYDYGNDHYRGFINNLDGGFEFWPSTVSFNGNLLMPVDPNELRETFILHQESKMPVKYPDIQDSVKLNIVDKISLMDNPIIVIIEN